MSSCIFMLRMSCLLKEKCNLILRVRNELNSSCSLQSHAFLRQLCFPRALQQCGHVDSKQATQVMAGHLNSGVFLRKTDNETLNKRV
jgi:hypothetical protein